MATVLFDKFIQAAVNGAPASGALLTFYQAGTTTKITIYTDAGATTPSTNPVVADADGVFAGVYIPTTNATFKYTLTDADGNAIGDGGEDDVPINAASSVGNDLTAIEALSGTGLAARTASEAWALRSIAAGTGISMSNGDGVSGNPTVAIDQASAADFRAATASKTLTADKVFDAAALVALTDGANIALDLSTGINFSVTLGGSRTLSNPTNAKVGQSGVIYVTQDATGSRTLSYGTYYKFAGGSAPTLTTTAAAIDRLTYFVRSSSHIDIDISKNRS